MEEHQKELVKILGLNSGRGLVGSRIDTLPTWAEIYVEIGKLKEKAENPEKEIRYYPSNNPTNNPIPLVNNNPNLHYHGSIPCYNNPCVWA